MENKINIAELLKDCPTGMELDCLLFKDTPVYFKRITSSCHYPIEIKVEYPDGTFEIFELSKEGCIYDRITAKCVIFPKGKTTWEGFVPPCKFMVGDRIKPISSSRSGIIVKIDDKGYYVDYSKGSGIVYISFTLEKNYELVPNKFDITTLKPFDKVLCRMDNDDIWGISLFERYAPTNPYPFFCIQDSFSQCIPYEQNKHLLGTTDDCDEFYKTWK